MDVGIKKQKDHVCNVGRVKTFGRVKTALQYSREIRIYKYSSCTKGINTTFRAGS